MVRASSLNWRNAGSAMVLQHGRVIWRVETVKSATVLACLSGVVVALLVRAPVNATPIFSTRSCKRAATQRLGARLRNTWSGF